MPSSRLSLLGKMMFRKKRLEPEAIFLQREPALPGTGIFVALHRDHHATVRLQVYPDARVAVRAPYGMPLPAVTDFVRRKRSWIERKRRYFLEQPPVLDRQYSAGEKFYYLGRAFELAFYNRQDVQANGNRRDSAFLWGARLMVPAGSPERAGRKILAWRREIAQKLLRNRLVRMHEVSCRVLEDERPLPEVKIRSLKRRWGSCSCKGEITLALHLSCLPLKLVDHVILHELCHLRRFDHSQGYYDCLGRLAPDYKQMDKELKSFQMEYLRD